VHYGATKIGRGELFECLELLTLLRSAALGPLIAREHAQRPQGVRRIERYAPELVDALAAAVGDHSRAGCTAALRTAADLYRELRAPAADAASSRARTPSARRSPSSTRWADGDQTDI